ncbi:MAG: tRNA 4-thiouridine(8) synthase ThiI [Bacilli bacterium]|nr:tRNA 4-thiouridine(8) synthase ThiI [Bacilli bacterium]
MQVIMIKYGELTTKKGNRKFFVNTLYDNIKDKLKGKDVKVHKDISRMYIEFEDKELNGILEIINNIFGIHEYVVADRVYSEIEDIDNKVIEVAKNSNKKTFKIETKRSDKSFPINSVEFSSRLGGVVLKNVPGIKVDVNNPELTIHVEIREGYTYIYTNEYQGLGGYPSGTLGKGLLMLSGGIDSPVAGYLTLKRGVALDCIYFESMPHTSIEARNKVIDLARKISKYTHKINLHIVPFTALQEAIYHYVREDYCITIMRRMMYRISEEVAKRNNCKVITNGESIGQVASQTLTSMSVINNVTNMPIIRPVACLDKLEIIDIAKKIDTYDISILPFEDCCTIFVPKHPVINPKLEQCLIEENKFDYETLLNDCIENINTIEITEKKENDYEDLL